jgi:hypothetical protein
VSTFGDLTTTLLDLELNSSDSNTLYTSTRRAVAINAGVAEFAELTECYIRRSTVTVSCNVAEYVVSTISDFSRLSAMGLPEYHVTSSGSSATTIILAGDQFPNRTELWLNRYESGWRQSTTPGSPRSFYTRADGGRMLIGFDTRPDVGSSEAAKLVIPYIARPAAMTSSTDVPFTVGGQTRNDLTAYHQAFPHYAAYRLLPLIGDLEGANAQLQKFLGYVARFLQNLRPKGGSHITMARNYLKDARRQRYADDVDAPNYR